MLFRSKSRWIFEKDVIFYTVNRNTSYPAIIGTCAHLPERMDLVGCSVKTVLSRTGIHLLNSPGLFRVFQMRNIHEDNEAMV
jgi:hypothetical protein